VTLAEASNDFSKFLNEFTTRYDQYFKRGLYFAGESFGGRYVPRFVSDIIRKQRLAEYRDALQVPIHGIVLVNALVDAAYPYLGLYDLFCTGEQDALQFNESTCANIAAVLPELERMQRKCQETLDADVCRAIDRYGMKSVYRYFQEEVDAKRHSPYDGEFPLGPRMSLDC
jgi:cathepsin A (carboxypeptidase C)